jgi:hypothetical protein
VQKSLSGIAEPASFESLVLLGGIASAVAVPLEVTKIQAGFALCSPTLAGCLSTFARNDERLLSAQVLAVVGRDGSMCRSDPLNRQSRPIGLCMASAPRLSGRARCLLSLKILAVHQRHYIYRMLRNFRNCSPLPAGSRSLGRL